VFGQFDETLKRGFLLTPFEAAGMGGKSQYLFMFIYLVYEKSVEERGGPKRVQT